MCNCSKAFVLKSTSATYTEGASLILETTSTITKLFNGMNYMLVQAATLPTMTTVVPVSVRVNGATIPLLDAIGNTLYSDQIHSGVTYELVYGSTPSHFKLRRCCCLSSAVVSSTSIGG